MRHRCPSWSIRTSATLSMIAACALGTGSLHAGGLADEAQVRFELGRESYARHDYLEALDHFLASNRLVPNRNVVFNIARTYQRMGRFPEAFRYFTLALDQEPDQQARESIANELKAIARQVAVVEVVTTPPGASLYLNRVDLGNLGTSPLSLGLAAGDYRLFLELPGYFPETLELADLVAGQRVSVNLPLRPKLGSLLVGGPPGGRAVVTVAGHVHDCPMPCNLQVPAGVHELSARREGYEEVSGRATVLPEQSTSWAVDWRSLAGSLVVSTDEPGALIVVDGQTRGFTPAVLTVPIGVHEVEVRLQGFETATTDVVVSRAQQVELVLDLKQQDEVIAASRVVERAQDAPSSVTILPRRELRAFAYPTIAEALRGVRGSFGRYDGAYVTLGFRGLGRLGDYGNRVLTLIDGQPVIDNWLGSSYVGFDGRVDIEDIQRIEVVRGPGSVLYGTSAVSGVINLVTRPQDGARATEMGVSAHQEGVGRIRVRSDAPLGRHAGIWASAAVARGAGRDYFFEEYAGSDQNSGYALDADGFSAGTLQGRTWWRWITAQWLFHHHSKRLPNGAFETLLADPRAHQDDTRGFLELRLEPPVGKTTKLLSRIHLNHYRFTGGYPRTEPDGGLGVDFYRGSWVGAEQRLIWEPSEKWRATLGVEGQLHFQVDQFSYDETGVVLDEERPYQVGAAYLLGDYEPTEDVRFSGGARVDAYTTFGSSVNPRAAVIIRPYDAGTSKLIGSRAFRAPSVYELYYSDGGITQVPSPDLGPETMDCVELEHTHWLSSTVRVIVAGYGNYVRNLIVARGTGSAAFQDPIHYVNSPQPLFTIGAELELRREWRQGWMLGASYSAQSSRFLADERLGTVLELKPAAGYREVSNAPGHMASIKGAVPLLDRRLLLASRLTIESGRFDRNEEIGDEPQLRSDPSAVWDVVFSGNEHETAIHWAAGVYNAFDSRIALPVGREQRIRFMPQSGRTLALSTEIRF